jgi:hypothetical protein
MKYGGSPQRRDIATPRRYQSLISFLVAPEAPLRSRKVYPADVFEATSLGFARNQFPAATGSRLSRALPV